MQNFFKKNQKGYAILFTVVIISAISAIAAGLSNTAYKQLILSSLAKDSQTAFYQSDTATDCALYADIIYSSMYPNIFKSAGFLDCGGFKLDIVPNVDGVSYELAPPSTVINSTDPCFRISVMKTLISSVPIDAYGTDIRAKGYNMCDISNPRVVEREIKINYTD